MADHDDERASACTKERETVAYEARPDALALPGRGDGHRAECHACPVGTFVLDDGGRKQDVADDPIVGGDE